MKILARILARLCFVVSFAFSLLIMGVSLAFLLELFNKSIDFLTKDLSFF